jgi:hypothetical protein
VIRLLAHLSRPQHRIGLSGFKWTQARQAEKSSCSGQSRHLDRETNLAHVFKTLSKHFVLFHIMKNNFQRSILLYHQWIWCDKLYIRTNFA